MQDSPVELRPFFQRRYLCYTHGLFDVRLSQRPPEKFRAKCPSCQRVAEPVDGCECEGKTAGPIPHVSKPRLANCAEFEFPVFDGGKFQKTRGKDSHARSVLSRKRNRLAQG